MGTNFRRADAKNTRTLPVDSANVINVGDLVYQEVDDVRAAASYTYGTTLAETQANFARQFIGVALTASASGDTDPITIGTRGVYEFVCASATFNVGDLVGVDDNATPDALLSQQVIGMGQEAISAIGRVTELYSSATTSVQIEILPGVSMGMVQFWTVGTVTLSAAAAAVTTWEVGIPFKLLSIIAIETVALTTADAVLTIEKGTTDLDDTLTIDQATSAIGKVTEQLIVDATGDDVYESEDTLSIDMDGGPDAGAATLILKVAPYRLQES